MSLVRPINGAARRPQRDRRAGLYSVAPCPTTGNTKAPLLAGAWCIRRTIVQARRALTNLRLDEASRATAVLKNLLRHHAQAHLPRYVSILRTLEAFLLASQDDFAAARSVLTTSPMFGGDTIAATLLRYLDLKCGERKAIASDKVDYLVAPVGGKALSRILDLCVSAALAFDRLHLTVSANLAAEALQLARQRYGNHSPMSCYPAILLAEVAYEQGRLEEAEALLQPRLPMIRASGILDCAARTSVLLARILLNRGRHRAALAILRDAERLGRARRWPRLVSVASSEYDRTMTILRYDNSRGSQPHQSKSDVAGNTVDDDPHSGVVARLSRIGGQPEMVTGLCAVLTRATPEIPSSNETLRFSTVKTALRRACSAASYGSLDECYEVLIACLRVGAVRGLRMIFVDADPTIGTLLERLYAALPKDDAQLSDLRPYIATLLGSRVSVKTDDPATASYRALSRREIEILQMIADGMSNKRIAQSLGIAPETVKSCAKSIFRKLATRTRAHAVARAEAHGLL
jgi:LuxR family transcriptional regulator, maltose regulon positive regulatory protein